MPDSRTLADCQIPVFKTHPTPVNVTVRPENVAEEAASRKNKGTKEIEGATGDLPANVSSTSQGCGCIIV